MPTFVSFLVFCQAFGAFMGAFATIWGEITYVRAMQDGTADTAERAHLQVIAKGLRVGMLIVLLSSLGLVISAYMLHTLLQPALTASYWTFVVLSLLIISVSWALSRRHISFSIGSAAIFTAWWFLAYLTLGLLPPLSFGAEVAYYLVAAALIYAILSLARFLALETATKHRSLRKN